MKKVIYIVGLLVVAYFLLSRFIPKRGIENSALAPDFEATKIDGSTFKLSGMNGNYVLLDFWGSWCGPCLAEAPSLVQLYKDYADLEFPDGAKFEIVSVALEKTDRHWKKVADKFGFIWPNQIVEVGRFVRMNALAKKYGVTDIPTKFLIDPNGNFIEVNTSIDQVRTILEDKINE